MDRKLIDVIVKFIKEVYKPEDVVVSLLSHTDSDGVAKPEYYIYVYFDYIDDKYKKNPFYRISKYNKEINIKREIRNYVENFFGVETSGVPKNGGLFRYKGLTIEVKSNEPDE